ncbi:MAG: murein biosynthesis integral membrane protein MurJ [Phycisphaerales bacterium]|nr:murein biosynthesis integral membrane protein MurJ [Phycisphaerales bacterium]
MADPGPKPEARGFERHALTVTLLTVLSRFGGLAREACFGRLIGISDAASAFGFAFLVPNLFRRLFGEGALSAALVPEQTRLEEKDPRAASRLAALTLARVGLFLAGLAVIGELIIAFIPSEGGNLGFRLLAITLPYMPLVCLTAVAGAVLQVRGRFAPAAAAPILLNLSLVIAVCIAWWKGDGAVDGSTIGIVGWGVVFAGVAQAIWTLWEVRRTSPIIDASASEDRRAERRARFGFRRVVFQALPMILGLGVLQLNTFLDGLIASWPTIVGPTILGYPYPLEDTAMATLGYAQRLYEFPLGVFGIAVATAIFPQLARERDDATRFAATLRRGLRLAMFIGLPASIGIAVVRRPFVAVVYEGMAFDAKDVEIVAFVLLGYAVAIWSYSINHILIRAFYARREPMTPVRIAIGMVLLNLTLNLTLVFTTPLGVAGLAWSTAICAMIQSLILGRVLASRSGKLADRLVVGSVLKTVICTVAMLVAVVVSMNTIPFEVITGTWFSAFVELSSLAVIGGAVFIVTALALRMPELGWALGRDATVE